jgi:site-specific recombinase XerD
VNRDDTDLLELWPGFALTLRAGHRSPRTLQSYQEAVDQFAAWLEEQGRPTKVGELTQRDVEGFVAAVLARSKPATAAARYRGLHRFFNWLVDEEELAVSPMARMHSPRVELPPPPVLTEDELRRLLKACEGTKFEDRRDMALLRVLIDTGCRRGELASLTVEDVDMDYMVLHLTGKGSPSRAAPFGPSTGVALNRYRRVRRNHLRAASAQLWLGLKGPMGASGIADAVRRRGQLAGLEGLHPHQLRHTVAQHWQLEGGNEGDLMMLLGWRSRAMLSRYWSSAEAERARESHRRLVLGDRL